MKKDISKELVIKPVSSGRLSAERILYGKPVPAITRLRGMSADDYEDFVNEWIWGCLRDKYKDIFHLGGAGDRGRDIAAHVNEDGSVWDNYQCKHYTNPLAPNDVRIEIAKLIFHAYNEHYPWPRKYYFVAPKISSKSYDLLKDTKELRKEILEKWEQLSKNANNIPKSDVKKFIEEADFSIFSAIPGERIIEEHKDTSFHAPRFGGGLHLSKRKEPEVTQEIKEHETVYVKKLLEAYSQDQSTVISERKELMKWPELIRHFDKQRECYYETEMLSQYSRENLPHDSNAFEELKEDLYEGIEPAISINSGTCKDKIDRTLLAASQTSVEANALRDVIRVKDKKGMCHHIANEKDHVRWTI